MRYRRKPTEIEAVQWDGTDGAFEALVAIDAALHIKYVPLGYWVTKGGGDYQLVDPDVFAATYEVVE